MASLLLPRGNPFWNVEEVKRKIRERSGIESGKKKKQGGYDVSSNHPTPVTNCSL